MMLLSRLHETIFLLSPEMAADRTTPECEWSPKISRSGVRDAKSHTMICVWKKKTEK
jgi:hypothetical protein